MTSDAKRKLDVQVVNGGKDDAFYGLEYDVAGSWRLRLDYDQIPHNFGNNGKILWSRTNDQGSWDLQDPIQAANQAALEKQYATNPAGITYAFLNGLLQPYLPPRTPSTSARAAAHQCGARPRPRRRLGLEARVPPRGAQRPAQPRDQLRLQQRHRAARADQLRHYRRRSSPAPGTGNVASPLPAIAIRSSRTTSRRSTSTTRGESRTRPTQRLLVAGSGSIGGAARGFYDLAPDNDMAASSPMPASESARRAGFRRRSTVADEAGRRTGADDAEHGDRRRSAALRFANREAEMLDLALNYGLRFGDGCRRLCATSIATTTTTRRYEFHEATSATTPCSRRSRVSRCRSAGGAKRSRRASTRTSTRPATSHRGQARRLRPREPRDREVD